MSKLRFSTNDYEAIAEFIANTGGLSNPTDEELDEIQEALGYFDALGDLVFLERT